MAHAPIMSHDPLPPADSIQTSPPADSIQTYDRPERYDRCCLQFTVYLLLCICLNLSACISVFDAIQAFFLSGKI